MQIEGKVLSATESVCPECLTTLPAVRVLYGNQVYLEKNCSEHGSYKTLLWQGEPAWETWVRNKIPSQPLVCDAPVDKGCPHDCGLCSEHRQHTCTALLEVTQRCNLNCSFCFASAGGNHVDPSLATLEDQLFHLFKSGGPSNLQLSGGEPTVRDDLPEIVNLAQKIGFPFLQINSNGLRLAEDPAYVQRLRQAGLNSVFLQFDGLTDEVYRLLRGRNLLAEKLQAIDHCSKNGLGVVLVPTLVPGVNTQQIGEILQWAIANAPKIRGVHFQPVSYFGRFPKAPTDEDRITIPQVMQAIEEQTKGLLKTENFKPPGCENAFCSFHGNFRILKEGQIKALSTHLSTSVEKAYVGASKTRKFVSQHWSGNEANRESVHSEENKDTWDNLLIDLKTHTFSISGMAFQDAWNLDLERLKDCCIHVMSPEGKLIPFCAYNLTSAEGRSLYRG